MWKISGKHKRNLGRTNKRGEKEMKTRRIIVLLIAVLSIYPSIATARYYSPQTGRYLTPDPIGLEGGINPYVYVENDPVNLTDPLGLDIAIQIGLPQGKNRFGHVAGAVTGYGVFSSGTLEDFRTSFTDYLRNQAAYRDSIIYIIPTSNQQDDAFVRAFEAAAKRGHSASANNCADITGEALKAAGLIGPNAVLKFPGMINGYMILRANEGMIPTIVDIQKGNQQWEELDRLFRPFNPR